jgi:hypothetical protein
VLLNHFIIVVHLHALLLASRQIRFGGGLGLPVLLRIPTTICDLLLLLLLKVNSFQLNIGILFLLYTFSCPWGEESTTTSIHLILRDNLGERENPPLAATLGGATTPSATSTSMAEPLFSSSAIAPLVPGPAALPTPTWGLRE